MEETLVKRWWALALRGFIALILGIILLVMDKQMAAALLVLFLGLYCLINGIFVLVVGIFKKKARGSRAWLIAEGIISLLLGVLILLSPMIAGTFILYFIAIWALVTGILQLIFSIAEWKYLPGAWIILVSGLISILLGGLIFANIAAGMALLVILIAIYLILFGVLLMILGFSLKNIKVETLAVYEVEVS